LYPAIYAFVLRPTYPEKPLIFAYAAFLLMSMTNPLFFSSMGMLILSSVMAKIALYEHRLHGSSTLVATSNQRIEAV
jgi:hypothetical protein